MAKQLEVWMANLAAKLAEDIQVDVAASDKLVGGVIELLIDIEGAHCEIIVVRSKKKHAHVAVFTEREAAARRLAELLGFAYRGISRMRNAERKLVHRIERCAKSLAAGWAKQMAAFPAEPLARLRTSVPEARTMCGRGYHVHVAGDGDDDHDKHRYDPLYAVSVAVGGRRRALVFQPQQAQFVAPAALAALLPPAAIAAGVVASDERSSHAGDVLEATSEVCCELPEFLDFLPDLGGCDVGDCVPDCGSFDIPDCDIGGCDLG